MQDEKKQVAWGVKSKTNHATEIGIVKSQLKKQFGDFEETFGYQRKFKREQIFQLPKTHSFDVVAICCEESEIVDFSSVMYLKNRFLGVITNNLKDVEV